MTSIWGSVADLLDNTATVPAYRWLCDRTDCDGLPHDKFDANHARGDQRPPDSDDFYVLVFLAGRGWGKSRTGSETLIQWVLDNPVTSDGTATEWLAAGATIQDAREVMAQGPSGLVAALDRRGIEFVYNRSLGVITLGSGQRIHLRGGDDDDLGRGLNLAGAWLDEAGVWKRAMAAWTEGVVPAVRQKLPTGRPHVVITATPKPGQGAELLRMLMRRDDGSVVVRRGATFANHANLSAEAIAELKARYPEGSRLYRQELLGEIVEDIEGALFTQTVIDDTRVHSAPDDLNRVVVAVDPAVTYGPDSDETGIVVVGSRGGIDRHFFILDDRTVRAAPADWGRSVILLADEVGADSIVYEINQGGSLVTQVINQAGKDLMSRGTITMMPRLVPVRASRGKSTRAEPVATLYDQGRVHHVGAFPQLEEQMTSWVPGVSKKSPDRLDALVWGVASLMTANARRAAVGR